MQQRRGKSRLVSRNMSRPAISEEADVWAWCKEEGGTDILGIESGHESRRRIAEIDSMGS
jgi:hypothetical protein